jgi:ERF superfamily
MTTPTPELNKALAAFQTELPPIPKGTTVHVARKETADRAGINYTHDYAKLEDLSAIVLPLLSKHGLAWTAWTDIQDDGRQVLRYALLHSSGQERGGTYLLPPADRTSPQQMGSALTYARRYMLCTVTGVAPHGEDDDAAAAEAAHGNAARAPVKRAARTRGPIPEPENMWHGPELPPPPAPKDQAPAGDHQPPGHAWKIIKHFERLGVTDRDVRLGYTATLTGHTVTTTTGLTDAEQKSLAGKLGRCRDRAALDQLTKQEAPA